MMATISPLDVRILCDEPSLSSASLSTTLNLLQHSFRPEFTHQCLEGEVYRGYRPLDSVLKDQNSRRGNSDMSSILHKSHLAPAAFSLDVQIRLAPSCRLCRLEIHRTPLPLPSPSSLETTCDDAQPPPKKIKFETPPVQPMSMSEEEIRACIAKALPNIVTEDDRDCNEDYLEEVQGTVLSEYSILPHRTDFVISVADGPSVASYHAQVQKLALWFIENADNVDVADDQSGFWKVLYLFEKRNDNKYSLVGYMTLFHFHAPFHKPTPGIILRICQALVLPPYQQQGHGGRLLQCVYDMAHGKFKGLYPEHEPVVQVNVEDPSPGFSLLRDKTDCRFLTSMAEPNASWWPDHAVALSNANKDKGSWKDSREAFVTLSDQEVQQAAVRSKLIPRQVQVVYELLHLRLLVLLAEEGSSDEELETKFRLMVKKRLNKEHREEIGGYPTKEEKKAYLGRLYEEYVSPRREWLQRAFRRNQSVEGEKELTLRS